MRGYTSRAADTRLEVVASDDDPRISHALGEEEYRTAIDILDRHYNLILVDTGTGILDSAIRRHSRRPTRSSWSAPARPDGARVAAMTLDWLEEHDHADLVRGAVAVVNAVHGRGDLELERIDEHFVARCSAVVHILGTSPCRRARTPPSGTCAERRAMPTSNWPRPSLHRSRGPCPWAPARGTSGPSHDPEHCVATGPRSAPGSGCRTGTLRRPRVGSHDRAPHGGRPTDRGGNPRRQPSEPPDSRVHRTRTTRVDATNAAVAYTSCDGCRAVALSFQS